jgi:hypothetical protein
MRHGLQAGVGQDEGFRVGDHALADAFPGMFPSRVTMGSRVAI